MTRDTLLAAVYLDGLTDGRRDAEAQIAEMQEALKDLVTQGFQIAVDERLSVVEHPQFHIALDAANRFLKRAYVQ